MNIIGKTVLILVLASLFASFAVAQDDVPTEAERTRCIGAVMLVRGFAANSDQDLSQLDAVIAHLRQSFEAQFGRPVNDLDVVESTEADLLALAGGSEGAAEAQTNLRNDISTCLTTAAKEMSDG